MAPCADCVCPVMCCSHQDARARTRRASIFAQSSGTAGEARSSPANQAGSLSPNYLFGHIGGVFACMTSKMRLPSHSPRQIFSLPKWLVRRSSTETFSGF